MLPNLNPNPMSFISGSSVVVCIYNSFLMEKKSKYNCCLLSVGRMPSVGDFLVDLMCLFSEYLLKMHTNAYTNEDSFHPKKNRRNSKKQKQNEPIYFKFDETKSLPHVISVVIYPRFSHMSSLQHRP